MDPTIHSLPWTQSLPQNFAEVFSLERRNPGQDYRQKTPAKHCGKKTGWARFRNVDGIIHAALGYRDRR